MKKFAVFCISLIGILCSTAISFAQSVQFKVTTENTPMPYTYVFVNRTPVGSTDTLGVFTISADSLQRGDTVRFRYVGTNEQTVVYDGAQLYNVTLTPATLDEVVVVEREPITNLSKITRFVQGLNWYEELSGHVSVSLKQGDKLTEQYQGQCSVICIPNKQNMREPLKCWQFSPAIHQGEIKASIENIFHTAATIAYMNTRADMNRKIRLYNNGESAEGLKTYSILRPYLKNAANRQFRIYVDPETKLVKKVSLYALSADNSWLDMEVSFTWTPSMHRYFPERVDAVMTDANGKQYEYRICETVLNTADVQKNRNNREELIKRISQPNH